jgi:hypothetical protein
MSQRQSVCPSARPEMAGSVVLGVVGGSVDEPRLRYLAQPQPVTQALLALAAPVEPTEVFRFAAPCAEARCQHFDGASCRLVTRTVRFVSAVVDTLPQCQLRRDCRWWQQEGREACFRCPQVVTDNYQPSAQVVKAALGDVQTQTRDGSMLTAEREHPAPTQPRRWDGSWTQKLRRWEGSRTRTRRHLGCVAVSPHTPAA